MNACNSSYGRVRQGRGGRLVTLSMKNTNPFPPLKLGLTMGLALARGSKDEAEAWSHLCTGTCHQTTMSLLRKEPEPSLPDKTVRPTIPSSWPPINHTRKPSAAGSAAYEGPRQKKPSFVATLIFHAKCPHECLLGKATKLLDGVLHRI